MGLTDAAGLVGVLVILVAYAAATLGGWTPGGRCRCSPTSRAPA